MATIDHPKGRRNMPRSATIVVTIACVALLTPNLFAADTTCPIVPKDVGHWLNLEYRAGTLAPEIADDPGLAFSILVVDRSLAKIDALLFQQDHNASCQSLLLPYVRLIHEIVSTPGRDGGVTESVRPVQNRETLSVRVCSSIDRRSVSWLHNGSLLIASRSRTDPGHYPRTYYSIYQVTADELAQMQHRNARLARRGKDPKPPRFQVLHEPLGDVPTRRSKDSLFAFFGAEFSLPPGMGEVLAEKRSTSGSVKNQGSNR